jgi:hypothetical protein
LGADLDPDRVEFDALVAGDDDPIEAWAAGGASALGLGAVDAAVVGWAGAAGCAREAARARDVARLGWAATAAGSRVPIMSSTASARILASLKENRRFCVANAFGRVNRVRRAAC